MGFRRGCETSERGIGLVTLWRHFRHRVKCPSSRSLSQVRRGFLQTPQQALGVRRQTGRRSRIGGFGSLVAGLSGLEVEYLGHAGKQATSFASVVVIRPIFL